MRPGLPGIVLPGALAAALASTACRIPITRLDGSSDAPEDTAASEAPLVDGQTTDADLTPPAAPMLTATSPRSPSRSPTPVLIGTAEPGSIVKLYKETCDGTPAATGTAAPDGTFMIAVRVPDNTSTRIQATATDAAMNASVCSAALTYVHDGIPPTIVAFYPSGSGVNPRDIVTVTFSEAIAPSSVTPASVALTQGGAPVAAAVVVSNAVVTLTPSLGLALIAEHAVTVAASVTDLAGNELGAAPTGRFATRDGVWSPHHRLEDLVGAARYPNVAMNPDGSAVAVWSQDDGTRSNIWASRYTLRSEWGPAELVETDSSGSAGYPAVGIDDAGNAVVAWEIADSIVASVTPAGAAWPSPRSIEDNAEKVFDPIVAVGSRGNAMVVWSHWGDDDPGFFSGARYTSAPAGWAPSQLVRTEGALGRLADAQIAADADGNAVMVWVDRMDNTRNMTWGNRYRAGVGWETPQPLDPVPAELSYKFAFMPRIAMDRRGQALVVWTRDPKSGTGSHEVWSSRNRGAMGWTAPEMIALGYAMDVAVTENGEAVVVWTDKASGRLRLWGTRRVSETKWEDKELIFETQDTSSVSLARVKVDARGNAVAVWPESTRAGAYIKWTGRYVAGKGWGTPRADEGLFLWYRVYEMGMDGRGNTVVVWLDQSSDICASEFR